MKKDKTKNGTTPGKEENADRRRKAEVLAQKRFGGMRTEMLSLQEVQHLVHELQTHQIELEMQNEELRETQVLLDEAKNRYLELYDFAPMGYFTLDENGSIIDVNLKGATMLGIERAGLLNMPFTRFISRGYQDTFYLHRKKVIETGEKQSCTLELKAKNGTVFYAALDSVPAEGKRCRTALSDVTKQRQMEYIQRQQQMELEHVYRNTPVGLCVLDRELRFIRINDWLASINGIPPAGHIGRTLREITPDLADMGEETARKVFETGRPVMNIEFNGTTKAQPSIQRCWLEHWLPLRDETGEVTGISVLIEEITDRKKAEAGARYQAEKIRAANETLNAARLASLNLAEDAIASRRAAELANIELRKSMERFELLAETAGALLRSPEPRKAVESLCRKVMTHLDCHVFFNFLVDEQAGKLHLNAFGGISDEETERIEWLNFGVAVSGCVARDAERIIAEHIPATPDDRTELIKSYGVKAYCCHPLLGTDGKVLGTLSFGTRSRETFGEGDVSLMQAVTDHVATAMVRIHNEEALKRSKEDLEIRVTERTAQLYHERKRFYDVLETLPAYIILLTPDHHVRFANRVFRELFGESNGRRCFEFLFGRSEPCEICDTYTVLKTMAPHEWEWRGPNGRTYSIYDFPFTDFDNSALILEMGIDITDRKKAEESLLRTTELLERVFSTTHVMIAYMDAAFNYVRVNRAYSFTNRRDPEFYEGLNHFDLYPDKEDEEIFRRVAETGEPYFAFEKPFEHAGLPGSGVAYRDWSLLPLKGADGKVIGLLLSLIDVTDRKQAEERISLFRNLVNQTSDAVIVVSPETGGILDVNNATSSMFGYSREELTGMKAADFVDRFREGSSWDDLVADLREKGGMLMEEWPRHRDGSRIPVEASLKYITLGGKNYVIADVRDIRERREAAEKMRVTNDLLNLFIQKISRKDYLEAVIDLMRDWSGCCCLGIRILDEGGNVPYEAYAGFSEKFWKAENMLSLRHDACFCTRAVQGTPKSYEMSAVTRNGSYYFNNSVLFAEALPEEEKKHFRGTCISEGFLSLAVIPIRYHETVLGALHVADRREGMVPLRKVEFLEMLSFIVGEALFRFGIEDNLRQNYQLLENVFSNIHLQIAYMDRDFNYIRVNRLYAESHGLDQAGAIGKNYFDVHPSMVEKDMFTKVVTSGEPYFGYADPFASRDDPGTTTYWDWSIQPIRDDAGAVTGLVLSCLDVTEKTNLQADAMRSSHLASVGEMAAGVAHEINNPINGIINYAQILVDGSTADSRQQGISRMIIEEGMRIANIVRSLLSFARDRKEGKGPATVQDILSSSLSLSEAQISKDGITLLIEIPDGLPEIFAQPQQIVQVFLNLINNARHALNAKYPHKHPDKVLRITGEEIAEDGSSLVMISFYDQGAGIPSAIIDKVMNPFFTTKPPGMGTGLGLSISHGIISDHGGSLRITSREGEYTNVAISLPVYRGEEK